ncbi:MAG TPA: hypothetical protein DCZ95_19670 [Verrucomicrobia bacterium]|nr:MAG: hypothetical protein A2X46_10895 [Lentisphaerae bacterium GWF2_57_35]HBA86305.1 hypothetical protein [Verrucomicrobiota bacterium]
MTTRPTKLLAALLTLTVIAETGTTGWAAVTRVALAASDAGIPSDGTFGEKQYVAMVLAWNHRTLQQAYLDVGRTNKVWDALAIGLLDGLAQFISHTTPSPNLPTLRKQAQAAIDAGCDDPLVLYVQGWCLQSSGLNDKAEPVLEKAFEGLQDSRYPAVRKAFAAMRLLGNKLELGPVAAADEQHLLDAYLSGMTEAITAGEFTGIEERHFFDLVKDQFQTWADYKIFPAEQLWPELERRLREHHAGSPWLLAMLQADYHYTAAWTARGSGFANTVTDKGWATFRQQYPQAVSFYRKACELRPDYPEAAAEMVAAVNAGFGDAEDDCRRWFERSLQAQFDYERAYSAYMMHVLPRWGGTVEGALSFGRECLATKRFDTVIPDYFWQTVVQVGSDSFDPSWRILAEPSVYDDCKKYFEGVLADSGRRSSYNMIRAQYMVASYRMKDFDTARRMAKEVGEAFERQMATPLPFKPPKSELLAALKLEGSQITAAAPETVEASLEYVNPDATFVSVVGDFNGWNPALDPMKKAADGVWRVTLKLPEDKFFGYRFHVDGQEILDPRILDRINTNDGRTNSLLSTVKRQTPQAARTMTFKPMTSGPAPMAEPARKPANPPQTAPTPAKR